jgi:hypothetical protein
LPPLPHVYWMSFAPSAIEPLVTSTHLPLWSRHPCRCVYAPSVCATMAGPSTPELKGGQFSISSGDLVEQAGRPAAAGAAK